MPSASRDLLETGARAVEQGEAVRSRAWMPTITVLRDLHLLTDKPVMYVANVDETGFTDNPRLDRVREIAERRGRYSRPHLRGDRSGNFAARGGRPGRIPEELKLEEPGLNRVIRGGYSLLGLQTYFTAGLKEVRAWTVRAGATAPKPPGSFTPTSNMASSARK